MIHCFCGNKDKAYSEFNYLLEKHSSEFKPVFIEDFNIPEVLPEPNFDHVIDYYSILKYSIKTHGLLYATKNVIPIANYIVTVFESYFKKGDTILAPFSPDYFALILLECCRLKKMNFLFLDTLYFENTYQLTTKPLLSYEITDFESAFHSVTPTKEHEQYLLNFITGKEFPFIEDCEQQQGWEHGDFDIFIPGEKAEDVVLLHKPFITTEELCVYLANLYPRKIIYYRHPEHFGPVNLPKGLKNVIVDGGCNQDIIRHIKEVHTIGAITGVEAELLDKETTWYSNTFQQKLQLRKYENKIRFFAAVHEFGFVGLEENFYNKIKELTKPA